MINIVLCNTKYYKNTNPTHVDSIKTGRGAKFWAQKNRAERGLEEFNVSAELNAAFHI